MILRSCKVSALVALMFALRHVLMVHEKLSHQEPGNDLSIAGHQSKALIGKASYNSLV